MGQIDLLRAVQHDERVLDVAAAAMYGIREPKGSIKIPFEGISSAKKARNRQLAIQVLTAVVQRYPDPLQVSNPGEIKMFMAEQMYKMLAPNKSESFPFDHRTPYAQTYYQERAETFMRNFLLPLAEQERKAVPLRTLPSTRSTPGPTGVQSKPVTPQIPPSRPTRPLSYSGAASLPPSRPAQASRPSAATEGGHKTQPALDVRSSPSEPNIPITDQPTPPPTGTASTQSNVLTMIGCLLVVIVFLLLILVARTF